MPSFLISVSGIGDNENAVRQNIASPNPEGD